MKKALHKIAIGLFAAILFTAGGLLTYGAISHADFNSSNVIDDVVFNNDNTMTAAQIDSFLNSFPDSCISSSHGFSAPDPTGYSPTSGFTYGGNVSAGKVIYDAAQAYGLNPEVLITTLQKEQSLVSGTSGCSTLQYVGAVGYGCPDGGTAYNYSNLNLYTISGTTVTSVSGTCVNSAAKAGFSQQIIHATWLLKFGQQRSEGNVNWAVINGNWDNSDDPSTCYGGPMTQGYRKRCSSDTTSTYYDGYTVIDGTSTHMDNGATAALYWYTPHFSGNQNFSTIFQSWFGPTSMPDSYFAVINTNPDNGANLWYLLTATGKYYIPSGDIYNAWGLNNYTFSNVSQAYFDSLPDGGTLGRVLKDQWGNMFFMDGGQLHYARDPSYMSLWGLSTSSVPQSTGLVYSTVGGNWMGRFMQDASTGDMWLMDGGTKHLVPPNNPLLYHWGFVPDQLTSVTSTYLNNLTDGGQVTQYVSAGGNKYIIDAGRALNIPDAATADAYGPNTTYLGLTSLQTLNFMANGTATRFIQDTATNGWYMLENGTKHYIPKAELAYDWGLQNPGVMTGLSDTFISGVPDGGNLSYLVQDPQGNYWLLDGKKHQLATTPVIDAWSSSPASVPVYSAQSLSFLSQGVNATTLVQPQGSQYVYAMVDGQKRFLPLSVVVNAWGYPSLGQVSSLSSNVTDLITENAPISVVVQNSGTFYLLMNGTAYPIDPTYADSWRANSSTPLVSSATLSRFTISAQKLGAYIKVGSTYYIMRDLFAIPVNRYLDAYGISDTNSISLPDNYFTTLPEASYLVKSTDTNDQRMWLISQGQKILFSSFAQEANYGYISRSVAVTALSPAVLSSIPDDTTDVPSLLIKQPNNGGVKLLSFGHALGFPDGTTLTNYTSSTNPILTVSPSVYDSFSLGGNTSRLIHGDNGSSYYMTNGQKSLIQNTSLLSTTYAGLPNQYLEGTTMACIPDGSPIN